MILRTIIIAALLISSYCSAQNLVPNPSFENYVSCPTYFNQLYLCQDWQSFGVAPDYYNSCGWSAVNVPQNNYGFQNAVTGNAYCGFLNCHVPGSLRDFIGAQLLQPLVIGQIYFVSLNVSRVSVNYCPTNKMGVLFSTVPFDSIHYPPRNDFAQVYTDTVVADTVNWFKIKGSFIADSAYTYIIIGNFFQNPASGNMCGNVWSSYYYVDDVCVSTDSTTCYSPVGINDREQIIENIQVFPNPVTDILTIKTSALLPDKNYITIYNIFGKIILNDVLSSQEHFIDVSNFSAGVYTVELKNQNKVMRKKFVKE